MGEQTFVLRLRIATIAMFSEYSHLNRNRDVRCTLNLHANMCDYSRLFCDYSRCFYTIRIRIVLKLVQNI